MRLQADSEDEVEASADQLLAIEAALRRLAHLEAEIVML